MGMVAADLFEEIESVSVLEPHIDQQQVVLLAPKRFEGFGVAGGGVELEALVTEPVGHRLKDLAIVIYQQQRTMGHGDTSPGV